MTDDRSLDRAARSWLEEGPTRASERTVDAALSRIQTTRQERDLRIPWRLQDMSPLTRIAAALAVLAIVVAGAYIAFRPAAEVGPSTPTIEGSWETDFTRQQMLDAGIVDQDEDDPENYGHFVLSLDGGLWSLAQLDGPAGFSGGTYTATATTVSLTNRAGEGPFPMPFTVSATSLTLGEGGPVTFRVAPWTRVAAPGKPAAGSATLEEFRASWKAVCDAALAASPIPNEELWSFDRLYDPAMSSSDRALSLEVGRTIAERSDQTVNQLQDIRRPEMVAADLLDDVTRGRGVIAIIREEIGLLAQGNLAEARALDESTSPLSLEQQRFEQKWGLQACP